MIQYIYIVSLSFVIAFPIGALGGMWLMNWANRLNDEAYELKMKKITDMENDEDLHQ